MRNEEAINLLDNLIGMVSDNHDSDYDTALRMAIDALRQPGQKAYRDLEKTLCALPQIQSADGQDYVMLYDVLETLRRYTAEPQR